MPFPPDRSASAQKILIVTRNLPPLVGGMERLNWHMADELSKYAEVRLIGPNEAAALKPPQVEFYGAPLKPLWRFLLLSGWQTIRKARNWKPDIILAGSGLTAPIALIAARLCGAQAGAYIHGLDIAIDHSLYRALWIPSIRCLDKVIANSTPTAELAKQAGVSAHKISIVHPGVTLPEHPQPQEKIDDFMRSNNLTEKTILLSVGRLTTRKGLREFVQHALPTIVAQQPDAVLVVIGDTPNDSLHAEVQTPQSIQAAADAAGVGANLRFMGVITDQDKLATAYQAAKVHIFPVRHIPGDPEGFGMVAIEAAAHGLPTVAFATGGIVDAVSHGESGYLVEKNNYAEISSHLLRLLLRPIATKRIQSFAQGFAWRLFGEATFSAIQKAKKIE